MNLVTKDKLKSEQSQCGICRMIYGGGSDSFPTEGQTDARVKVCVISLQHLHIWSLGQYGQIVYIHTYRAINKKIGNPIKVSSRINRVNLEGLRCVGYGLDGRSSIPGRGKDESFSLRHRVLTASGAHPASYPMGTGCYLGNKVDGT
jgi:hypothetical protein